ncbi:LysR substrate-binding domain-containing protein [Shewanella olleyana]|uniref:LysR substrate-binding domain-containing protein n=1 Tax=Shewanella olleyana TaxID=135626 RepID=UPI0020104DBD|nr:LysR substrate-binding domain-containing protein [Shewanella olleyana]MCL1068630.1 LysR substrate-binding domain-containing protein [Shewanella olleyana]
MPKKTAFIDKITLKMLRYFYELSLTGHFGKAASQLSITNSPLSSQIKELEMLLGVELVERNSRNVKLTDAGQVLQSECGHLFGSIEHSMLKVQHVSRRSSNQIQIGIVSSSFWAGFGDMINRFNQLHPQCMTDIIELSPQAQKQAILDKKIDIGIVRFADALDIHPLSFKALTDENFVVAMASNHEFNDKAELSLADLRNQSFTFMQRENSASASLIINECRQSGFVPNVVKELIEPTTLMAYVAISHAVAVVPSSFAAHQWEGVLFVPLKDIIPACLCAVYDKHSMSESSKLFIDSIDFR